MLDHCEVIAVAQVSKIVMGPGAEVIKAQNTMSGAQEAFDKVGPQEPGTPGDENALSFRGACGKVRRGGSRWGIEPLLPEVR